LKCNPGVSKLLLSSIKKCPIDTRRELLNNVVLSGGVTLTSGFVERLENEVALLKDCHDKGVVDYLSVPVDKRKDVMPQCYGDKSLGQDNESLLGKLPPSVVSAVKSYIPKRFKCHADTHRAFQ
jgi:actin-related protein